MAVKFANLASTTLAGSLTNSATAVSVTDASSFPALAAGDYFYASIGDGSLSEIVKVTAVSSNTFTAVRGQDSTTARSHDSGTSIALRVVAAALDDISSADESVSISGDTMTGNLSFGDNVKATFGDNDLQIFHDGFNSYVNDSGTGDLVLKTAGAGVQMWGGGDVMFNAVKDGAVTLYYDNAPKLATSSSGIDITGNANFADNGKASFGTGSDMSLFHNGNNAFLDNDTGTLFIQTNGFSVKNAAGTESMILGAADGAVTLYHNNLVRLATSSSGIDVTGTISSGAITSTGTSTFTTANNSAQVTLISTDTDALVGPQLNLWRNSGTGTNGDLIGQITFTGEDTVGSTNTFATIYGVADQTDNGAEDGSIHFQTLINGALADRLEINSAGNSVFTGLVSIGTASSPNRVLHVEGTKSTFGDTQSVLQLSDDTSMVAGVGGGVSFTGKATTGQSDSNTMFAAIHAEKENGTSGNTSGALLFSTRANGSNPLEAFRVDSNGNVGIAEADPKGLLHVDGFDYSYFSSNVGSATLDNEQGLAVGWNKSSGGGETVLIANQGAGSSGGMAFATNTSAGSYNQRMLLDASGNLLVGKGSAGTSNVGVELRPQGYIFGTGDGINPLRLNRKTSDGMIADFQKDGDPVGSIGVVNTNNLRIGGTVADHAGIQFGTNILIPESGGSAVDGGVDLGYASGRFKDLHLSGNVTTATVTSSGNITAGDASTAAEVIAHYSDGSRLRLQGFGLTFERTASYVRPVNDGTQTLYVGGSTDDLDWNQIHFRSSNGLYMNGSRFMDGGNNLHNIGSIDASGTIKLNGNYPLGVDNVVIGEGAGASFGTGAQDNVLIGDLAGNQLTSGDYNTCIGSNAGSAYTTHTNSVAIGNQAGLGSTQTSQTLVGSKSGYTDPAFASTALGFESLMFAQATAYRATALGYRAFRSNTIGQNNTGAGYQAGSGNTTTSNNTYVGAYSGDGTAVGGGYNTAVGAYALTSNLVSGSGYNTCVGGRSGLSVTSGSDNTLIGYGAGDSVSSGADNTAVGYNALSAINTENGNVAVGHNALGVAYSTVESTCVGSGAGSAITTGSKNTILGAYSGNEDGLDIRTLSNRVVLTDGDGNIGLYIDNSQDAHFDGNVIAYSTTISDRRLKSQITNISNALDKVGQINGVTFVRNQNGEKAAGIVAQEIMEVLPEAVKSQALPLQTGEQDKEYYVVEYDAVTGLLVEAIKELKARVEALESR